MNTRLKPYHYKGRKPYNYERLKPYNYKRLKHDHLGDLNVTIIRDWNLTHKRLKPYLYLNLTSLSEFPFTLPFYHFTLMTITMVAKW